MRANSIKWITNSTMSQIHKTFYIDTSIKIIRKKFFVKKKT